MKEPVTQAENHDEPADAAHGPAGRPMTSAREAYAFTCLSCGYGWEQAYEIEHFNGLGGRPKVRYLADGVPVPSPLLNSSCAACDGSRIRIMSAGQVAAAERSVIFSPGYAPHAEPASPPAPRLPRRKRRSWLGWVARFRNS